VVWPRHRRPDKNAGTQKRRPNGRAAVLPCVGIAFREVSGHRRAIQSLGQRRYDHLDVGTGEDVLKMQRARRRRRHRGGLPDSARIGAQADDEQGSGKE
jgi:hypothetical protein